MNWWKQPLLSRQAHICVMACFLWAVPIPWSIGQETPGSLGQLLPEKTPDVLGGKALQPDAIYLRNAEGELIFVPKQRYEDFAQYLRDRTIREANVLPAYTMEGMRLTVQVRQGYAEVELQANVTIAENSNSAVPIPLELANFSLTAPPEIKGGQTSFIKLGNDGKYVWWVVSDETRVSSVTLRGVIRMGTLPSRSNLRLDLPPAPAQIQLNIPGVGHEVQLTGSGAEVIETQEKDGNTISDIRGKGGVVQLSWKTSSTREEAGSIEVDSIHRFAIIEQSRYWKGSTNFKVQFFGTAQERELVVRLPARFRWLPNTSRIDNGDFSIEAVSSQPLRSDATDEETRIAVRIDRNSMLRTIEFTIEWEFPALPESETILPFQGLEVENVARHETQLEIDCPTQVRLIPDATTAGVSNFRQSRSLVDPLRSQYVFRFARQPIRLDIQVRREGPKLILRPSYWVIVVDNRIELTGLIELISEGSDLSGFQWRWEQWELDRFEPYPATGTPILVERDAENHWIPSAAQMTAAFASTPTTDSSLTTRRVVRIQAHRIWDRTTDQTLQLKLPLFEKTRSSEDRSFEVASGYFVLSLPSNTRVATDDIELTNLVVEQQIPAALPEAFSPPLNARNLVYRTTGGEESIWQGRLTRIPQQVSVSRKSKIHLGETEWRILQTWNLDIENEPLRRLPILLDRRLVRSRGKSNEATLEISVNDKPVAWTEIPDSSVVSILPDGVDLARWAMIEIASGDLFGSVTLECEATFRPPEWSTHELKTTIVPLAWLSLPNNALRLRNEAVLSADPMIQCELPPDSSSTADRRSGQSVPLSLSNNQYEVRCLTRIWNRLPVDDVLIDRGWLQTLCNTGSQRLRWAVRFRTELDRVQLELPPAWNLQRGGILLNGNVIDARSVSSTSGLRLEVDLPGEVSATEWNVLEVWTMLPREGVAWEVIRAEFPKVHGNQGNYPKFWEVLVPSHQLLIGTSSSLDIHYRWTWEGWGWARRSLKNQRELEEWIGASQQLPPPQQANQYLFSALAHPTDLQVQIAPRFLLWLPVATVTILFLGTWLTWMSGRIWWPLLGIWLLLLLLILLAPDLAILVGQTFAASMLLVLIFRLTQWLFDRRARHPGSFTARTSGSMRSTVIPPQEGSAKSVVSAPSGPATSTGPATLPPPTSPSGTASLSGEAIS